MAAGLIFSTLAVAVGALSLLGGLTTHSGVRIGFSEDACENVREALEQRIVGQTLATRQISDSICDHLRHSDEKPLVISVHGPPGVGKSFLHSVLADALFLDNSVEKPQHGKWSIQWTDSQSTSTSSRATTSESAATHETMNETRASSNSTSWLLRDRCTPFKCPGYRILFGTSYMSDDKDRKFKELRHNLMNHVRGFRESLLVIEEYDKMDCKSRGLLKELIDHAQVEKIRWGKSVVILESNSGYLQLMKLLRETTQGHSNSEHDHGLSDSTIAALLEIEKENFFAEKAQKILKDIVFDIWHKNDEKECSSERVGTLKTLGMIDMFVPFFPLQRMDIEKLFENLLTMRSDFEINKGSIRSMTWHKNVVKFLASRVEYEGEFSIEGAKEGRPTMSRHVTRAIHEWNTTSRGMSGALNSRNDGTNEGATTNDGRAHLPSLYLRVAKGGGSIECISV